MSNIATDSAADNRCARTARNSKINPEPLRIKHENDLLRVVITRDNRTKGNFVDNTVIVLSGDSSCFTAFLPNGEVIRQLSEFATRRYASRVSRLIEFRNTYLEQPYFCSTLEQDCKAHTFETRIRIPPAHWPRCVQEAVEVKLVEYLPNGTTVLKSQEELTKVAICPHGLRFYITFPLLIAERASPPSGFTYLWQSQVFFMDQVPERWKSAASLVECLHTERQFQLRLQKAESTAEALDGPAAYDSSLRSSELLNELTSTLPASTQLPTALERSAAHTVSWDPLQKNSWWASCADTMYPKEVEVLLDWTPSALLRVIVGVSPATVEAEALLLDSSVVLRSSQQGTYVHHFTTHVDAGVITKVKRVFANEGVPARAYGQQAALQAVTQRMKLLRRAAEDFRDTTCQAPSIDNSHAKGGGALSVQLKPARSHPDGSPIQQWSNVVMEESCVDGTGVLTAYADGRVKGIFGDRTRVEMDQQRERARVVLPYGEVREIRVDAPIGVESYVAVLQQFASWAFSSATERMSHIQATDFTQASVAAHVDATQRFLLKCQANDPLTCASLSSSFDPRFRQDSIICHNLMDTMLPDGHSEIPSQLLNSQKGGEGNDSSFATFHVMTNCSGRVDTHATVENMLLQNKLMMTRLSSL
ncbi:hypothetical protein CYMTET_32531 [Cymbomonas tetramitiformis]|uniref:Uncharacterized protein n=1 Tax=Cymbomonas tetramitiformis TaxID=36881 RepID=A0AAE0FF96_9CHLO|nr:hypothetical protein CYMTET_32531 [Cymbomonas tetramitiformis]